MSDLQTVIDAAWEDRNAISPETSGDVRSAVERAIAALDYETPRLRLSVPARVLHARRVSRLRARVLPADLGPNAHRARYLHRLS